MTILIVFFVIIYFGFLLFVMPRLDDIIKYLKPKSKYVRAKNKWVRRRVKSYLVSIDGDWKLVTPFVTIYTIDRKKYFERTVDFEKEFWKYYYYNKKRRITTKTIKYLHNYFRYELINGTDKIRSVHKYKVVSGI